MGISGSKKNISDELTKTYKFFDIDDPIERLKMVKNSIHFASYKDTNTTKILNKINLCIDNIIKYIQNIKTEKFEKKP